MGNYIFALPGALCGVVVSLFVGQFVRDSSQMERDDAVARAREALDEEKEFCIEVRRERATFTFNEELTGLADVLEP